MTLNESSSARSEQIETLRVRVEALGEQVTRLEQERERYRALYLEMLELNKKLERGLLGQKAEKLPADQAQLTLQLLATPLGAPEPPATPAVQEVAPHTRRKPTGRKPLPENLPRVEIEICPRRYVHGTQATSVGHSFGTPQT